MCNPRARYVVLTGHGSQVSNKCLVTFPFPISKPLLTGCQYRVQIDNRNLDIRERRIPYRSENRTTLSSKVKSREIAQ